ncbi:MAG: hypothetical protein J7499_08905 [Sphingopyxis sp.]|nr:hypothetical protein [Sphingopyxis sp.]
MRNRTDLTRDNRGATAAIFAMAMPLLAGMGALAVDVGLWTVQKREAQGAADQAAFSAAIAAQASGDDAGHLEGKAIAASMGFIDGQDDVTVTTNKLDSLDGDSGEFWEVIVEKPQTMGLAALFLGSAPTARARAVAGTASGGAACIIGLSTSGTAISIDNNNSISNPGCAVYSNANMSMKNGSTINGAAYVAGSIDKQNAGQVTIGREVTGVTPVPDPYADVPSPGPCTNSTKITNGGSYSAGQFCAGIEIRNNASNKTLNLASGTYVVGGILRLDNGVTINGTGVTLVLRPGTTVTLGNNLVFNLTAPTSGSYAGIAMMGRNLGTNILAWNNAIFNVQGAFYFPNQELSIKNNSVFNSTQCTQLVGLVVSINNNANMNDECPGSGIRDIGNGKVALLA